MSGAVQYRKLEWNRTAQTAFTLRQGLRNANAKVLVYRGDGVATYRLLCSNKVAKGLLQDRPHGTSSPWVEQGSMTWDGYKKFADEILVGNVMEVVAAVEEETQFVPPSVRPRGKKMGGNAVSDKQ